MGFPTSGLFEGFVRAHSDGRRWKWRASKGVWQIKHTAKSEAELVGDTGSTGPQGIQGPPGPAGETAETDFAWKSGPTSYYSAYKANWARGGHQGTSFNATSSGTGITINEDGYYLVQGAQRTSGTANRYFGISLNGSRSAIDSRTTGAWTHDHADGSGNHSHSSYLGWLNQGEIISGGWVQNSYATWSSAGYAGYIYILRIR
ncbi:MAG: hypothetical protein NZ730_09760 [Porticoccaceae bacterium]|nr:hypothetical protein [Porticoccaceae bacterium]